MRKFLLGTVAVATIATMLAAGAPKAQAGAVIDYSLNGGATFSTLGSGPAGTMVIGGSPTLGAFVISNVSEQSNSPGTPSLGDLLSSSLDIKNTSNATASIVLVFSDTNFTLPVAPPNERMDSHVGGSVTVDNNANLASFTSCLSTTNTNLTSCTGATKIDGPGTPNIKASSFQNDQFLTVTSMTGPYSVTEVLSVTLGAGSDVGFQANTAIQPMPEPMSLSLLGAALIAFGVIGHRRARS